MTDNRNTILAVILSGLVLIAWQYFFNMPQMEKQRAQQAQSEAGQADAAARRDRPTALGAPRSGGTPQPAATAPISRPRRRWWSPAKPRSPPPRASRSRPRASPAASR